MSRSVKVRPTSLALIIGLSVFSGKAVQAADTPSASTIIEQGKYLSVAADCGACHNSPTSGAAMAGGYAIASPMGNIIASNITPSVTAGIGNYTEQQFARAVREGVNAQGDHLYPAMPYTSYSKMTDSDIHALYQYFMHGVQPVDTPAPATKLPFPFSIRSSMALWNMLFASQQRFTPDSQKSAQLNRGDYLVNVLEHCDACHTPRNFLMGQKNDLALSGGQVGSWYAPNITSDKTAGIGSWSDDQLFQYLKTGHVAGKAQAAGPMAEAIENSLQHLSDDDLHAIVAWLKQVPASGATATESRFTQGAPSDSEAAMRATDHPDAGWVVFSNSCANCHQANGEGSQFYPSLFHNSATGAAQPDNLIATILFGVRRHADGQYVAMPAFGPAASFVDRLNDQQVADVANYVLKNYGNASLTVTADQVKTVREGGPVPAIAYLSNPAVLAIGALIVLVILGLIVTAVRRRGKK
ncbi:c-type cytochrome [Tatumella citrea]|uniref:Cytochrome C n=1 Tax=Tatumella citrea TaxID=53336 RepID=A0A1Y0LDQ9_TATCI|nr:c-type cytochrome [Tatumella citrea]ARU95925.1 cytochrome C [Tatumella citrea]ARU99965.1 cytochrome C [Tatumella citrea]